jgi:hypothetical protein
MIQSSVNSFGDVFMSGNAAAGNIEGFVYTSLNAFSQTTVNFVGQNVGAGQLKRVKRITAICLGCVFVLGSVLGSLTYLFGEDLLSIYITDSQQAIAYGKLRMGFLCLPYFLCGMMEIATGALRGLGAAFTPMLISVLGVVGVRITWLLTVFRIPAFHTPDRSVLFKEDKLCFRSASVNTHQQRLLTLRKQRIHRHAEIIGEPNGIFKIRNTQSPLPGADRLKTDHHIVSQRPLGKTLTDTVVTNVLADLR